MFPIRKYCSFLLAIILLSTAQEGFSQKLYLEGDTILITANARPTIILPEEVRGYKLSYPRDYSIMNISNSIMITANGTPHAECVLNVVEGKSSKASSQRMHSFIILFLAGDQTIKAPDLIHNYSDIKKVTQRMKELEMQRSELPAATTQPATPPKQATPDKPKEIKADAPADQSPRMTNLNPDQPVSVTMMPAATNTENKKSDRIFIDGKELSDKDIHEKAMQNIQKFSQVLKYLCQQHSAEEYEVGIRRGISYFINDTCFVEVSSLHNDVVKTKKIKKYLEGLAVNKYSNVDISWSKMQFISKLTLNPDGTYRGQVQFEQTFTAQKDGVIVYSDRTEKIIEIILVVSVSEEDGERTKSWDIKLSNISVKQTRE